jgi:hypothetical protein
MPLCSKSCLSLSTCCHLRWDLVCVEECSVLQDVETALQELEDANIDVGVILGHQSSNLSTSHQVTLKGWNKGRRTLSRAASQKSDTSPMPTNAQSSSTSQVTALSPRIYVYDTGSTGWTHCTDLPLTSCKMGTHRRSGVCQRTHL